jgi:hypothetical protein
LANRKTGENECVNCTCASCSNALGTGATVATAFVSNEFFVQARDCWGNIRTVGGDQFTFTLKYRGEELPASQYTASWRDLGNGVYHFTYTSVVVGKMELEVILLADETQGRFVDDHIIGSPFSIDFRYGDECSPACGDGGLCIEGGCNCVTGYSGADCNTGNLVHLLFIVLFSFITILNDESEYGLTLICSTCTSD